MKTIITIEARMGSSRFPGKVMNKIGDTPMIEFMVNRLKRCKSIDDIVVATTTNSKDDKLVLHLEKKGIKYHRGSEDNVLERVLHTAEINNADIIVELHGDNPLMDPVLVDKMVNKFKNLNVDYLSNTTLMNSYPRGSDIQVFWTKCLRKTYETTSDLDDLEHVSLFIYNNPDIFKLAKMDEPGPDIDGTIRLSVDYVEDFNLINKIVDYIGDDCTLEEISTFLNKNKNIRKINEHVVVNYINDNTRNGE